MSRQQLVMASNGLYGVLLHNRENCTESEIRSLVSQYGKIRAYFKVDKPGGADLIFIHFQEYDEARACLEQLAGDPMFNAMPARPRETRSTKPNDIRPEERTKSLTKHTGDDGAPRHRSILRRSRSAFEKRAKERDDSSSSDDAKVSEKEVRFLRPRKSSLVRRQKITPASGRNNFLTREFSMLEESLCTNERIPYLQNVMDFWAEKEIEETGVFTSTEVLIYNLPLHVSDGLIYSAVNAVVGAVSIEVHRFNFNNKPYSVAVVQLRTPDDARLLKKCVHRKILKGKIVKVIFSSEFQ